jgi:hypothetical protein
VIDAGGRGLPGQGAGDFGRLIDAVPQRGVARAVGVVGPVFAVVHAASPDDVPPDDPGLIALTVAEIKRLFNLTRGTYSRCGFRGHLSNLGHAQARIRAT